MNGETILNKSVMWVVAALTATLPWVSQAEAQQTVTKTVSIPAQLQGALTTFACENNPGPFITFEGSFVLRGVNVELVFRNNINKDVHTRVEQVAVVSAIATDETIVIPKQPSRVFLDAQPETSVTLRPETSVTLWRLR
jgi:hypothetical protein